MYHPTQHSNSAQYSQYLQPQAAMPPAAQYSTAVQPPPRSLSPLPQSHSEFRARLEAAGVAPEQIATVLSPPQSQQLQPPPLPSRPPSSNSNYATNQASSPNYGQPSAPPARLTFEVYDDDLENDTWDGVRHSSAVVLGPGASISQPTYRADFTYTVKTEKDLRLKVYRNDKSLMDTCDFYPPEIQIESASAGLGPKWNPDALYWSSQCGTIGQGTMRWVSHWDDPYNPNLTCVCTGTNVDGSKHTLPAGFEMCKITAMDKEKARARLELAPGVYHTQDQLDEMVGFAMIQLCRYVCGFHEALPTKKKDKISTRQWFEVAKVGMELVNAFGGGGS